MEDKKSLKNSFFLVEAWNKNKMVTSFILFFICAIAFFNVKHIETTPFFIWSHYSTPHSPLEHLDKIELKINGKSFDLTKLNRAKREMIVLPIYYFIYLKANNFSSYTRNFIHSKFKDDLSPIQLANVSNKLSSSKEDEPKFGQWLKSYLAHYYTQRINSIEICVYDLKKINARKMIHSNYKTIKIWDDL